MTADSNYKLLGCISFECMGKHKANGLCSTHYMRLKRTGSFENLFVECVYCNKKFESQRQNSMYCSSACKMNAWRCAKGLKPTTKRKEAPSKFCNVFFKVCASCGQSFTTRWETKEMCSDVCRRDYASEMPALKMCKCCGVEYKPTSIGGAPSAYCGLECAAVIDKATKRICKAKRRAVLRGATVESVDPFKVFDRDGWICRLCGVKTPKSKRGTYADNAPELDHINPLANGGEHSYINTQCSCRKCNGLKGARAKGQTLLFG